MSPRTALFPTPGAGGRLLTATSANRQHQLAGSGLGEGLFCRGFPPDAREGGREDREATLGRHCVHRPRKLR